MNRWSRTCQTLPIAPQTQTWKRTRRRN